MPLTYDWNCGKHLIDYTAADLTAIIDEEVAEETVHRQITIDLGGKTLLPMELADKVLKAMWDGYQGDLDVAGFIASGTKLKMSGMPKEWYEDLKYETKELLGKLPSQQILIVRYHDGRHHTYLFIYRTDNRRLL